VTQEAVCEWAAPPPVEQYVPPFEVGVVDGMPAERYHRTEAMSSGGVRAITKSARHFRLMRDTINQPTAAMVFGTAVHDGVLEPAQFGARVVCAPKFDMRKTVDKEAAAEFRAMHAGKSQLPPEEFDRARRCIDAVQAHPSARKLLDGAIVERSFFWNDARYNVPCKARWDASNRGLLIDLKTTKDASPDEFAKSIAHWMYHAQMAHYISAAEHLLDASPQAAVFIAVESEPPHLVACYELPGNAILAGLHIVNLALAKYADAISTGTWPGYPETIEAIQLPRWALRFD